jgi:hypothetical protein
MVSFISKVSWLGVILLSGLSACSRPGPHAKAAFAHGMSAEQYRAAYEIAAARCDRQTNACSAFSSHDECIKAKLEVSAADAQLPRCSNDVDQTKVQSCIAEIERRRCGTGIARLEACQKSELCPYVSEEAIF